MIPPWRGLPSRETIPPVLDIPPQRVPGIFCAAPVHVDLDARSKTQTDSYFALYRRWADPRLCRSPRASYLAVHPRIESHAKEREAAAQLTGGHICLGTCTRFGAIASRLERYPRRASEVVKNSNVDLIFLN